MWTISSIKENAKFSLQRSYWPCVLMSLIFALVAGGSSGGSAGSSSNRNSGGSSGGSSLGEALQSLNAGAIIAIIFAALAAVLVILAISLAVSIFLLNPLSIGCYRFFIEAANKERTVSDFGCLGMGFRSGSYKNVVKTLFFKGFYSFLWSLLFIIPGIIKAYEYRMIPYILAENPDVTKEEAFALSKEMMDGEKWNSFILDLSFIGWLILSLFTCGILAVFYVSPYMNLASAHLYEVLKKRSSIDYFDHSIEEVSVVDSPYSVYEDGGVDAQATFDNQSGMFDSGDIFTTGGSDPFDGGNDGF